MVLSEQSGGDVRTPRRESALKKYSPPTHIPKHIAFFIFAIFFSQIKDARVRFIMCFCDFSSNEVIKSGSGNYLEAHLPKQGVA